MISVVEFLLILPFVYLAMGLICSVALHLSGLRKIDPATVGAGWWFRLLITPGLIAFWPLMLARWRRADRTHFPAPGAVHRPLSARGIRRLHGRLATALLLLAPLSLSLAIVFRPARPAYAVNPLQAGAPPARGEMAARHEAPFDGLPIELSLRTGSGAPQLELALEHDLPQADLLLYWTPERALFPRGATYLGNVWGPGRRRYDLNARVDPRQGLLVLYSLSRRERVGEFPMNGL